MSSICASFASSLFIFLPNHFVNFIGQTAVGFCFCRDTSTARNCFFFSVVRSTFPVPYLSSIEQDPRGVDFSLCQLVRPKQFKDRIATSTKQLKLKEKHLLSAFVWFRNAYYLELVRITTVLVLIKWGFLLRRTIMSVLNVHVCLWGVSNVLFFAFPRVMNLLLLKRRIF